MCPGSAQACSKDESTTKSLRLTRMVSIRLSIDALRMCRSRTWARSAHPTPIVSLAGELIALQEDGQ
jgi:hypothetical protein